MKCVLWHARLVLYLLKKIRAKVLRAVGSSCGLDCSLVWKSSRQCYFEMQFLTKMIKCQQHVFILLVACRRILELGLSHSGVACHVVQ
jgi:hypothetical protein